MAVLVDDRELLFEPAVRGQKLLLKRRAILNTDIEVVSLVALWTSLEEVERIGVLLTLSVNRAALQLCLFGVYFARGDSLLQLGGKEVEVVDHFLDQPRLVEISGRAEEGEDVGIGEVRRVVLDVLNDLLQDALLVFDGKSC